MPDKAPSKSCKTLATVFIHRDPNTDGWYVINLQTTDGIRWVETSWHEADREQMTYDAAERMFGGYTVKTRDLLSEEMREFLITRVLPAEWKTSLKKDGYCWDFVTVATKEA